MVLQRCFNLYTLWLCSAKLNLSQAGEESTKDLPHLRLAGSFCMRQLSCATCMDKQRRILLDRAQKRLLSEVRSRIRFFLEIPARSVTIVGAAYVLEVTPAIVYISRIQKQVRSEALESTGYQD